MRMGGNQSLIGKSLTLGAAEKYRVRIEKDVDRVVVTGLGEKNYSRATKGEQMDA